MKPIRLAVVGCGPKAAAIAARAVVERELKTLDVNVTIFEKHEICANWTGRHGYTDGGQYLCTPALRDVGFPYKEGKASRQMLHKMFSWPAYQINDEFEYSEWVNRGCLPATHSAFADYIRWILNDSGAELLIEEVISLKKSGRKWIVETGSGRYPHEFDGVVVTGPGPAKRVTRIGTPVVFDGAEFWSRLTEVRQRLEKRRDQEDLVVIGAGGTAAAILSWIRRNGLDSKGRSTIVIGSQATLFSRGDSYFENQLFSDPEGWAALSKQSQDHFFERINRGVVWASVMSDIRDYRSLEFLEGRATRISGSEEEASISLANQTSVPAQTVIDASGFDAFWFEKLLPRVARPRSAKTRERRTEHMTKGLRLAMRGFPPLHVPGLSKRLGPGLASLMSMGLMSEMIFNHYRQS